MSASDGTDRELLDSLHNHLEGMVVAEDEQAKARRAAFSLEDLIAASNVSEHWPLQMERIQYFARTDPSRVAPLLIKFGDSFFPHSDAMCAIDQRLPTKEVNVWGRIQSSAHRLVRDLANDFVGDIWNACDERGFARTLIGGAPSSGPSHWSPATMCAAIRAMPVMDDESQSRLATLIRQEREELNSAEPVATGRKITPARVNTEQRKPGNQLDSIFDLDGKKLTDDKLEQWKRVWEKGTPKEANESLNLDSETGEKLRKRFDKRRRDERNRAKRKRM